MPITFARSPRILYGTITLLPEIHDAYDLCRMFNFVVPTTFTVDPETVNLEI